MPLIPPPQAAPMPMTGAPKTPDERPSFSRRGISLVGLTDLGQKDYNQQARTGVKAGLQTGSTVMPPPQAPAPPMQNRIGGMEGQP